MSPIIRMYRYPESWIGRYALSMEICSIGADGITMGNMGTFGGVWSIFARLQVSQYLTKVSTYLANKNDPGA